MGALGKRQGFRPPTQAAAAAKVCRWSFRRLWVAAIRRHSERTAARALRLKRSIRRFVLIWGPGVVGAACRRLPGLHGRGRAGTRPWRLHDYAAARSRPWRRERRANHPANVASRLVPPRKDDPMALCRHRGRSPRSRRAAGVGARRRLRPNPLSPGPPKRVGARAQGVFVKGPREKSLERCWHGSLVGRKVSLPAR
jgi:hypothetical protein